MTPLTEPDAARTAYLGNSVKPSRNYYGGPTGSLPSPLWERVANRSDSEGEPGEGFGRLSDSQTPHPPSLGFASACAPSPTRGEGRRS